MIVLDTHAWVFWAGVSRAPLSRRALTAIESADVIGICPISCWEIAMLVRHGRLELSHATAEWVELSLCIERVQLLPFTPTIALTAGGFDDRIHGDPADRIIMATALHLGAPLVTKDDRIRGSKLVETIW